MAERRFTIAVKRVRRGQDNPEVTKVQRYLTRFGYLRTTAKPGRLDAATSDALRSFQRALRIRETGELDAPTAEALERPRCGVPDTPTVDATRRGVSAEFVLRGCKYQQPAFSFLFQNDSADVAGTQERPAVQRAFNTWAAALCGVTFQQTTGTGADFTTGWFTGSHGDGSPFDGIGNTLAHAFYPPPCGGSNAGSMHFDEAETWSVTGSGGTFDVETVALHEIGHLLGLDHSTVPGSVMFPTYGGVRRALTQDDTDGIRRLYPALCRRGDSGGQAGFVGEIDAARLGTRQVLTAVRTQAGDLKLIAWRVNVDGSVNRTGDSGNQAGTASSIAIARPPSGNRYITACRTSTGSLRLISWDVNPTGSTLTRRGDSGTQAGTASLIRVVPLSATVWVTACRTAEGRLRVIAWRLNSDGSFTRLADSGNQVGTATDVDMTAVGPDRVVTAVRTTAGNLRLITWRITNASVQRLGDSGNQAGSSRTVKVVVDPSGNVVTAVKTTSDKLKLITWRVQASGSVRRLGDSGDLAGVTRGHDLAVAPNSRLATVVRTEDEITKVILWQTDGGGAVSRWGDSDELAGSADLPTLAEPLEGNAPVVTCVRTTTSSLKLITWGT
jgi:hypothetical protein